MKEALGISERLSPFVQSIGIMQSVFEVTPLADDGLIERVDQREALSYAGVVRKNAAAYSLPVIPRGVSRR